MLRYALVALVSLALGVAGGSYIFSERPLGASSEPTEPQTFLGGITFGNTLSTSTTQTTQTLSGGDVARGGYALDHVSITPNTGDLTLTWPASSTLKAFIPKTGMVAHQCYTNASTTAGIDITIAAGTGFDLRAASSSVLESDPVLTILADTTACITYIRKSNSDIRMLFTRYGAI